MLNDEAMGDEDVRVIQLPEFEWSGYSPCFEYRLPSKSIPREIAVALTPWVRQFATCNPKSAMELLQSRWREFANGPCQELIEYLCEFEPSSIVTWQDESHQIRGWVLCRSPETNGICKYYLLGEPLSYAIVLECLQRESIDDSPLAQMLSVVGGLREDLPPNPGLFVSEIEKWDRIDHSLLEQERIPDSLKNEFAESLLLFYSRGGETLWYSRKGRIAWYRSSLDLQIYADNSVEWIECYTDFQIRGDGGDGKPFDPYP